MLAIRGWHLRAWWLRVGCACGRLARGSSLHSDACPSVMDMSTGLLLQQLRRVATFCAHCHLGGCLASVEDENACSANNRLDSPSRFEQAVTQTRRDTFDFRAVRTDTRKYREGAQILDARPLEAIVRRRRDRNHNHRGEERPHWLRLPTIRAAVAFRRRSQPRQGVWSRGGNSYGEIDADDRRIDVEVTPREKEVAQDRAQKHPA